MNADIESLVNTCITCQENQPSQTQEPMMSIVPDVPHIPWHTIGTDLFSLNGYDYMIIADYFSKFPLVKRLNNDATSTTVTNLTAKMIDIYLEYSILSFPIMVPNFQDNHIANSCKLMVLIMLPAHRIMLSHMVSLKEPSVL